MPLSSYAANMICDVITDQGAYTVPTNFYLALCTSTPDSSMDGTTLASVQPVDGSFYRPQFPDWNWSTSSGGVSTYNTQISLTPANDWGSVTHFAICDAATAGNMYWFGVLSSSFYVYASGSATNYVPAGNIRLTVL